MVFKQTIRTRYSETGQDGIIHHSSYVVYLEVARIEFLKLFGCDINALEKSKIFCPVIDLSVKYLKPLHSLEDIDVFAVLESFTKVRFTLTYQIFREKTLMTEAVTSHCFLNGAFKPIPIPQEFMKQFAKLTQAGIGKKAR